MLLYTNIAIDNKREQDPFETLKTTERRIDYASLCSMFKWNSSMR